MAGKSEGWESIRAQVPSVLNTLVGPVTNRGVQGDLPAFLETVDRAIPAGDLRQCLHAGLWVLADDLDRAHRLCQDIDTPYGAAWHAVVHRREGDFWNSKYWWRRAGGIRFEGLNAAIRAGVPHASAEMATWLKGERYDAAGFVDLVERFAGRAEMREALVTVQRLEWAALFQECWNG